MYVDVTIDRWQKVTGKNDVLANDGHTFTEISLATWLKLWAWTRDSHYDDTDFPHLEPRQTL